MESQTQNLKAMQILFRALLIGQVLFLAIAIFLVNGGHSFIGASHSESLFIVVSAIISAAVIAFCFTNCLKKIQDLSSLPTLNEKIEGYRKILILQSALCEGAVLFCIISYMLSGNQYLFGIIAIVWIYILQQYPSKDKLVRQLDLDDAEAALFDE